MEFLWNCGCRKLWGLCSQKFTFLFFFPTPLMLITGFYSVILVDVQVLHDYFALDFQHHCRRCGGLFCNSCTQQRMILRGQGDSPVRICEPCKKLEEAARFEMRHGYKSRAGKGIFQLLVVVILFIFVFNIYFTGTIHITT